MKQKIVTNPYENFVRDTPENILPSNSTIRFWFGPEWSDYVEITDMKDPGVLEIRVGDAQLVFEPVAANVGRIRMRR
jgi:hypothetical protein